MHRPPDKDRPATRPACRRGIRLVAVLAASAAIPLGGTPAAPYGNVPDTSDLLFRITPLSNPFSFMLTSIGTVFLLVAVIYAVLYLRRSMKHERRGAAMAMSAVCLLTGSLFLFAISLLPDTGLFDYRPSIWPVPSQ